MSRVTPSRNPPPDHASPPGTDGYAAYMYLNRLPSNDVSSRPAETARTRSALIPGIGQQVATGVAELLLRSEGVPTSGWGSRARMTLIHAFSFHLRTPLVTTVALADDSAPDPSQPSSRR